MNALGSPRQFIARCSVGARLHTSASLQEIQKLTRLRVVDNSKLGKAAMMEGRPPRCIHIYNKKGIGYTGMKTSLKDMF
ncbi:39S ribosomal protein L14-like [Homarus americanus]|uniref:39S ribosomal protein L14-like n=1 Tax=Homarus americanus TaxID=6706 RepID=A0A8J5JKI3_HOMAM|nr:39S ribosomal protein L14-like [Homarus americanus]